MKNIISNHRLFNSILTYGLSTALNRGSNFLLLPLLVNVLTLSEFGIYNLVIVTSQLLVPIISLNGSTAILREGAESSGKGFDLLKKYLLIIICLGLFLFMLSVLFLPVWISFSICLAIVESFHLVFLTQLRSLNKRLHYFLFVLIKVLVTLSVLLFSMAKSWDLYFLLANQILGYLVIFIVYIIWLFSLNIRKEKIKLKDVLLYSLILIPHGVSQWILNSSDRLIIKQMLGDEQLGIYSISYSLAMVILLVNSGISLALPQYIIKNYEEWKVSNQRRNLIYLYSGVTVLSILLLLSLLELDKNFFHILKHYHQLVPLMVVLISVGMYLLGLYYFYGNFLFYRKKTGMLSIQTFFVALINIVFTITLVFYTGILGAAISTLVSYTIYLILIIISTLRMEDLSSKQIYMELKLVPVIIVIVIGVGFVQTFLWS